MEENGTVLTQLHRLRFSIFTRSEALMTPSQVKQSIKMSNCSDSAKFSHVVFNLIEKHCSVYFLLIVARENYPNDLRYPGVKWEC